MVRDKSNVDVLPIKNGPIFVSRDSANNDVGQAAIRIEFDDKAVLTAAYWRLTCDGRAVLSSFYHQQLYGLATRIDAVEQLRSELSNNELVSIRIDPENGDLILLFADDKKLQVFNFTGYEIWSIYFPDGTQEFSNHQM